MNMIKMAGKFVAILLIGFTLAGCAGTAGYAGGSAAGQSAQRDRASAGY